MEVRRDRTAITRSDLSRPVQLLISRSVLAPNLSFFDYGCGLGGDVRLLQSLGYEAHGWDPAHQPCEARRGAAVVNLGYVLNVIERPAERADALRRAFDLADKCLCVAVLLGSATYSSETQSYGDGLLTSRRTFQKRYHQEEAGQYLKEILGVAPIPLEAGIFLVFKESADAYAFLLNRIQRPMLRIHGVPRQRGRLLRAALIETFQTEYAGAWAEYADFAAARARPPAGGELDALRIAAQHGITPADLWEEACNSLPRNQLAERRRHHVNQHIVFTAIGRFRGVPRLRDLPATTCFDIRYFFRSYNHLKQLSDDHLFAAGDSARVARLCEAAPVGVNTVDGYFVARRDLASLDPTLQIYARLGELFSGDLDRVDVIKVHKASPRLSLFSLSDMRETLPRLTSRVKIDLQSQQVRYFDHSVAAEPELLIGKQLLGFDEGSTDERAVEFGRTILLRDEPFGLIVRVAPPPRGPVDRGTSYVHTARRNSAYARFQSLVRDCYG